MRKAIAIFFMMIFLVSFTEAKQLLKLPTLVQHYSEHLKRDGKTTFVDFLKQHYLYDHMNDGDTNEDNRLPFKATEPSVVSFIFSSPPVFEIANTEVRNDLELSIYRQPYLLNGHLFFIFHPPRLN